MSNQKVKGSVNQTILRFVCFQKSVYCGTVRRNESQRKGGKMEGNDGQNILKNICGMKNKR